LGRNAKPEQRTEPPRKRAGNTPRELEADQLKAPGCKRCGSNFLDSTCRLRWQPGQHILDEAVRIQSLESADHIGLTSASIVKMGSRDAYGWSAIE